MRSWNPEWVQAGVAIAALLVAAGAAVFSLMAYRNSFRPVLRIVPARKNKGAQINADWLILKNIGRGAAVSVVVVEQRGRSEATLMGEVDALEPLGETYGPKFVETKRIGRISIPMARALVAGQQYRVLYQDIEGQWHETEFTVTADGFAVAMLGRRQIEEIPEWVQNRAQVVTGR